MRLRLFWQSSTQPQQRQQNKPMACFEEYKNRYRGKYITDEESYINAQIKALAFLRTATSGRIDNYEGMDKENCVYALCDEIVQMAQCGNGMIASENVDGYSVSYTQTSQQVHNKRLFAVAVMYLPSELFYRGI